MSDERNEIKRQLDEKRKDVLFMERLRKSKEKWAEVLKRLAQDD